MIRKIFKTKNMISEPISEQDIINQTIMALRPHFLCNVISSISQLCKDKPEQASVMADTLADFMSKNMYNMMNQKVFPFNEELTHLKNYINLEEMRFGSNLDVTYHIRERDFFLPGRVLQPLVECLLHNHIKNSEEVCHMDIGTRCSGEEFLVEIKEAGPDCEDLLKDIRTRIASMEGAFLSVENISGEEKRWMIHIPDIGV